MVHWSSEPRICFTPDNMKPIHSTRRNLATIARHLLRLIAATAGALVVLALYIALCWLAYAVSYNPQN